MTRKTKTRTAKARRERRLHEEPQDSFWRDYDDAEVQAILREDAPSWSRYEPVTTVTTAWDGRSFKMARPATPLFDLDRMLTRPRLRFPDFDWITDSVATGGMVKTKTEAEAIVAAGITHVINASSELWDEHLVFEGLPVAYLYNPTPDDFQWKDKAWFAAALDFALPALAAGGKVYAHCLEGVNRGPSMAYAILREQGHDIKTARELIRVARPRAKVAYALNYEHEKGTP